MEIQRGIRKIQVLHNDHLVVLLLSAHIHPNLPRARCHLQLPSGLVLLHADHPRVYPHRQRLTVSFDPFTCHLRTKNEAAFRTGGAKSAVSEYAPTVRTASCGRSSLNCFRFRIKGWWLAHHFITTVCTAILLIWPDSQSYHAFRQQFIWFSFYISKPLVLWPACESVRHFRLLSLKRFRSALAVLLPERLSVPAEGPWRERGHGHHYGSVS